MIRTDPTGMDWYSYVDDYGAVQYQWDPDIHSQRELNKVRQGATYLGKTYEANGTYYSLFGSKKDAKTFEGEMYKTIDGAIISYAEYVLNPPKYSGGEVVGFPQTSFVVKSLNSNEYHRKNIEYEGSYSGFYQSFIDGKDMSGYMEYWIGDSGMPKVINSYFGKSEKVHHILYRNKTGGQLQGSDILHLKYAQKEAQVLLNKYNRLFPRKK